MQSILTIKAFLCFKTEGKRERESVCVCVWEREWENRIRNIKDEWKGMLFVRSGFSIFVYNKQQTFVHSINSYLQMKNCPEKI